jgi:hypothetical protein
MGAELGGFLGGASVPDARSYGGSGTEYPHEQQADHRSSAGKTSAQLGHAVAVNVFRVGAGVRRVRSFPSQVVALRRLGAVLLTAAIALFVLTQVGHAREATDISFRTGIQLQERLDQEFKDRNGIVALQYFLDGKMSITGDGLAEIKFRVDKEDYDLFFVPFVDPARPTNELKSLVLSAVGPNGRKTLLGTLIPREKEPPEVKQENVVVDGKLQPGNGQLKSIFKCSVGSCLPAGLGCLYGGAAWLPCFCLWCGGGIISCSLLEVFLP